MSKLDKTDVQGLVLRGYNFPYARYLFLQFEGRQSPEVHKGQRLVRDLIPCITTGEEWKGKIEKPQSTVNIAFTYKGLAKLDLPAATLVSFPVEFIQGMKARGAILCDQGTNGPEHWDEMWKNSNVEVHALLDVSAQSEQALKNRCEDLEKKIKESGGAKVIGTQDANLIFIDGKKTNKEHFGYTDGFGNPSYQHIKRSDQPGQGKLGKDGTWEALATGELLLGYADEAGELPPAPVPHLLANNGTFMVYRKLKQHVGEFRKYLKTEGAKYAGGEEKLAAKIVGRWLDGTPVELSPDKPDPDIVKNPGLNVNFTFGKDLQGTRCPVGAHIRRANPRDAFGFNGDLVNRRRITRRGIPYGEYVPWGTPVDKIDDNKDRGLIFVALNASTYRQFEFIQQQWIEYGNDAHQGSDKDMITGNHEDHKSSPSRFFVQGTAEEKNPPFVCAKIPNFVQLKGGDYFFLPSITALHMIGTGTVDPR